MNFFHINYASDSRHCHLEILGIIITFLSPSDKRTEKERKRTVCYRDSSSNGLHNFSHSPRKSLRRIFLSFACDFTLTCTRLGVKMALEWGSASVCARLSPNSFKSVANCWLFPSVDESTPTLYPSARCVTDRGDCACALEAAAIRDVVSARCEWKLECCKSEKTFYDKLSEKFEIF